MKNNTNTSAAKITFILPSYLECSAHLISSDFIINYIDHSVGLKSTQNTDCLPKEIGLAWLNQALLNQTDTVAIWAGVAAGRRLLKIPTHVNHIQENLKRLEGRQHQIILMLGYLINNKLKVKTTVTRVKFKRLSLLERQNYIDDSTKWYGRLGGYIGVPHNVHLINAINGDPGALFGIPFNQLHNLVNQITSSYAK